MTTTAINGMMRMISITNKSKMVNHRTASMRLISIKRRIPVLTSTDSLISRVHLVMTESLIKNLKLLRKNSIKTNRTMVNWTINSTKPRIHSPTQ